MLEFSGLFHGGCADDLPVLCVLHSAAAVNDLDTIKAWHIAGADMNCCDYDHRTPLHIVSGAFVSVLVCAPLHVVSVVSVAVVSVLLFAWSCISTQLRGGCSNWNLDLDFPPFGYFSLLTVFFLLGGGWLRIWCLYLSCFFTVLKVTCKWRFK